MRRGTLRFGLPLLTFAAIAAAWQILASFGGFPPKLVPGFDVNRRSLRAARRQRRPAGRDGGDHLSPRAIGFLIAAVIGVLVGIAMGRRQWVEDTLLPIVELSSSDPRARLRAAVRPVVRVGRFPDHPAGRRLVLLHRHHQYLEGREGGQADLAAIGRSDGRARPRDVPARRPACRLALHPDRAAARASRMPGAS